MNDWVFAYGSLVNVKTWPKERHYKRTRLLGWQRQWRHKIPTETGDVCSLTIHPNEDAYVDGLIIKIDHEDKQNLDQREIGYQKIEISKNDFEMLDGNVLDKNNTIYTHVSLEEHLIWAFEKQCIRQSYVDAVCDGYYAMYGEQGLNDFFQETAGWLAHIINDRLDPVYPRAVTLDTELKNKIDILVEKNCYIT